MQTDMLIMVALTASFALVATAHVILLVRLCAKRPHWHLLVSLLLPPMAPYLGYSHGFRWPSVAWLLGLVCYLGALVAALQ